MRNWPRAVLFDFDGVIVNSEPVHCLAFQRVLAEEGITLTENEYYAELIGFDDRGAFGHILRKHRRPVTPESIAQIAARKLEAMRGLLSKGDVPALRGACELVNSLRRNYPLAICSGALREEIEIMLEGIGLRGHFDVIVSAEDVSVGKPDPMGYLLTARRLSEHAKLREPLTPGDCLVIEDAPTVTRSVRAAGFPVLAVATTYPLEALKEANWSVASLDPQEVRAKIPELRI